MSTNASSPAPVATASVPSKDLNIGQRMFASAIAGMTAATFCHPLDVFRVQMQLDTTGQYKNTFDCGRQIFNRSGPKAFYAGLSAAYLRQWLYGSCRMGIYSQLLTSAKEKNNGQIPDMKTLAMYGIISGSIGSFCGSPTEIALVRMTGDSKLPAAERRNYSNVFQCIVRMTKEEGVLSLWRGATPTIIRAAIVTGALNGSATQSKAFIIEKGWIPKEQNIVLLFVSIMYGSFIANTLALPFDVVKSRIQAMKSVPQGQVAPYSGMADCARKVVAAEGITALWKGFTPAFVKLAPYSVISLTTLDTITRYYTGKGAL